ncbi:MAG: NADH-quinone oxidoreductase subunit F [Spirochaetes bacterium]|nr:MAG: NADH-quinone oxidoreductase subunit F [Spirochaetota bacterium]
MKTATAIKNIDELYELNKKYSQRKEKWEKSVAICAGTGCRANKAVSLISAFKEEFKKKNIEENIVLKETGCHGLCEKGPLVVIRPDNIFYQHVKPEDVIQIVDKTILSGEIIESLLYVLPEDKKQIVKEEEIPFYKWQKRLVFGQNGHIDPRSIEDYFGVDGYSALAKVLTEMTPEQVIEEIEKSGLRGRGGGGFPTGRKWRSTRNAEGDIKYVICNADEGDPGAYMDRSLLEGNPHSVIEGMIIGAYAIGANQGYVYVRNEYPLAVENLLVALEKAREYGLLGENILGTDLSFDIKISKGGGAFVCGESTALMLSIEGKVGEPRTKHIHTSESGLYERPTNLNNVETWANVPIIINRGADWYRSIGTENSKGTKIFSLVGKVVNTGLVEVPMGITLKQIIFDIGGGIPGGKKFKAVQTGGPSGGCIPSELLDMPVDFDELTRVGSMMGSGGMIVMDEDTCMVDVARYFLSFLVEESCGKCTPCRDGNYQLYQILNRITEGEGKEGDIELLEEIAETVRDASLCALGKTAPNPVLSTIRYFRDEYEKHITDKKCPAGVCKNLFNFAILEEKCTGCMLCLKRCPQDAIVGERKQPHSIIQEKCIKCGICFDVCRYDAVIKV